MAPPARGGAATEAKVDRYAVQAGNGGYDSDADADDEFERSQVGVASPTVPTHFDDDHSDPHSDSSEHESIDGEDTPTTQGWADVNGRSPTVGNIEQWNEMQVAEYITSISPALKQYSNAFIEGGIVGEALVELRHEELSEMGVKSIGHRLTILRAVYEQKLRCGIKIEEDHYVPLSAEGNKEDMHVTQDDIARVIESIKLRDERIIAAEAELRVMKKDLDRIYDENKKLREETLPIVRMMKDQRTPLPDPSGGQIPSPRDIDVAKALEVGKENKGSSLSRKFSTKKLFLGGAPKQPSPTHPPTQQQQPPLHTPLPPREVRDDGTPHLEASAAALAASSHLTASMTSQTSPSSLHGSSQLSPTSPAYSTQTLPVSSSGNSSYPHPSSAVQRSFPREATAAGGLTPASAAHEFRASAVHPDEPSSGHLSSSTSHWSQASTVIGDAALAPRREERRRGGQGPIPSPRDDDGKSTRGDRGDRDNPAVEIFKSFRVSIDDPCRVVLPVALKRYNITDDWRQYALYIVHGDQERCLGLEEKPLLLFKQLDREGRKPMFMLRRHAAPQEGWSGASSGPVPGQDDGGGGGSAAGGGAVAGGGAAGGSVAGTGTSKPLPGGVI